jgi:hypothetical protein
VISFIKTFLKIKDFNSETTKKIALGVLFNKSQNNYIFQQKKFAPTQFFNFAYL